MNPRKDPMDPPDFVIPAAAFGLVVYTEEQAVGFQYLDPDGGNVFVAVPGQSIRWLIDDMEKLIDRMPEVEEWGVPSVPGAITH